MATATKFSVRLLSVLLIACAVFFRGTVAEIRFTKIRSSGRSAIPIDDFGFTDTGSLELNVSQVSYSSEVKPQLPKIGFFLCPLGSWDNINKQINKGDITCLLDSKYVTKIFTFEEIQKENHYEKRFNVTHANQFSLFFSNCNENLEVSVDVRSIIYNLDPTTNRRDYLSAGKSILPSIYFLFFLIYAGMAGVWIYVLYSKRLSVFRIHFFMLVVVILKALNLLCEAEDKSYIKRTGSAHGWDVLFYIFSFLKGITLFSLIVLIGTGWSFLKPYLQDKDKKVLMIVIPLQIISNVAQVVIDETSPYAQETHTWKQVFLLVDVICCCAVLFPIVWSIKNLREAAKTDGKAAVNLMKLTLFKHYYIIVICYIYFTRVAVYILQIMTSYRYQWTSVVAEELATVAFYAFTGYNFRPKTHNPYFALDDEEEEAAAEALKLEDEFEL